MGIMVTMNNLALELLPLVPGFALKEMQELSVGTHNHNRECIREVVGETEAAVAAERSRKGRRKRLKTRRDANMVGTQRFAIREHRMCSPHSSTNMNCWWNSMPWEHG